jgi:guanosine-3',5'-bis(diphosphate) 3'-pyrophosphohydrolase
MSPPFRDTIGPLLQAVSFAGRAHRHQLRKDGQTPYACHVFRVCLVLRQVFGIDDVPTLTAAVLHDTIEDTTTDWDDLEHHFGKEVAGWVALLSKDTRQPDGERERAYEASLAAAPWQVQVCKLADIFDNLMDSTHLGPRGQANTIRRSQSYLAALQPRLAQEARKPFAIVTQLLTEMTDK